MKNKKNRHIKLQDVSGKSQLIGLGKNWSKK